MEWDQALFRWVYRGACRLVAMSSRRDVAPQGLGLDTLQERLALLAGCLAGEPRTIVASADAGGPQGDGIRLPAHSPVLDAELGGLFFRFRTAYAVTSQRLGFVTPKAASEPQRVLAALLAVPVTLQVLDKDLPGLAAARQPLFKELAERQTTAATMSEQELALLALVQRHLGGIHSEPLPAAVREFLEIVQQHPIHHPAQLDVNTLVFQQFGALGRRPGGRALRPGALLEAFGYLSVQSGQTEASAQLLELEGEPAAREITERSAAMPKSAPSEIEVVEFDEDKQADNPLVHSFEKLHTVDEYQGGRKSIDDEDELALHQEALDEVDLRKLMRTASQARSVYRMDAMLSPVLADVADMETLSMPTYKYDEWDYQSRSYRKEFCNLYLETAPPVPPDAPNNIAFSSQQVAAVRRAMERLDLARRFERRQVDGAECDIDALVDRYADLKSGHTPTDKCYIDRRRIERELAVLILIDTSLSSDSWIENRRVLDITKDAVGLVGHAAERIGEHFSVAAFHSHSRRDCRFIPLKTFSEAWDLAQSRLDSVQPAGYTRIGPAVRHATKVLSTSSARRKLLLLFTDAKPTDYDRYEGQYGIEDVRRAVEEAMESGVHCFTVAIGKSHQAHLPRMFGKEYRTLVHPLQLARTMAELYARLGR